MLFYELNFYELKFVRFLKKKKKIKKKKLTFIQPQRLSQNTHTNRDVNEEKDLPVREET